MSKYTYDIHQFNWSKELNTFFGDMGAIWDTDNKYKFPFPSGRKQFTILNEKTGGFRRFRLKCECYEQHWYRDIDNDDDNNADTYASFRCLVFESEDGIICKIYE